MCKPAGSTASWAGRLFDLDPDFATVWPLDDFKMLPFDTKHIVATEKRNGEAGDMRPEAERGTKKRLKTPKLCTYVNMEEDQLGLAQDDESSIGKLVELGDEEKPDPEPHRTRHDAVASRAYLGSTVDIKEGMLTEGFDGLVDTGTEHHQRPHEEDDIVDGHGRLKAPSSPVLHESLSEEDGHQVASGGAERKAP